MSGVPRVVYSIGARFAGGGIGSTAYEAVLGLERAGLLERLLCGSQVSSDIPAARIRAMGAPSRLLRKLAAYDQSARVSHWHNLLYDRWARERLPDCDVFHGWNNHCLATLRRARERGALALVERASTHPAHHDAVLAEEHRRWGLARTRPGAALARAEAELAAADRVLVPSSFVSRTFLERGFPRDKIVEIPFGVDVRRFHPSGGGAEARPFRLLFVGQLGARKGILYVLAAWRRLGWSDAELWIAGREAAGFGRLLRGHRASNGLRWLGVVSDPPPLYREADAFVLPSLEEGSALVTYEALASGLPVVTTAESGSVVRDGVEGFLIPVRDVEVLADRLERLRSDPELRREMGRAARDRALDFTWERYREELVAAVKGLVR